MEEKEIASPAAKSFHPSLPSALHQSDKTTSVITLIPSLQTLLDTMWLYIFLNTFLEIAAPKLSDLGPPFFYLLFIFLCFERVRRVLSGAKRAELGIFIYSTLVEQLLCAIVGTAVGAVYTAVTKTDKTCCLHRSDCTFHGTKGRSADKLQLVGDLLVVINDLPLVLLFHPFPPWTSPSVISCSPPTSPVQA